MKGLLQILFVASFFVTLTSASLAENFNDALPIAGINITKEEHNLLRNEAEAGSASAQNRLGIIYEKGQGVEQNDKEAVKWFKMAAEQGLAIAQYNLGIMYFSGRGLSKNDRTAAIMFRKAAKKGHANAQNNLGLRSMFSYKFSHLLGFYKVWSDEGDSYVIVSLSYLMYESLLTRKIENSGVGFEILGH